MCHLPRGKIGEVALRQGLQSETGATSANRHDRAITGALDPDLGTFRQFAHDLIKHVRGHGGGARRTNLRSYCLGHFEIEVSGLERQLRIFRFHQDIA